MNCEEYKDIVAGDVDGTLTAEEEASAAQHVASCPRCATARREQQIAKQILRERATRHGVPEDVRRRVLATIEEEHRVDRLMRPRASRRRVLAGAIAALLAVVLYSLFSARKPDVVALMVADVKAADAGRLDLGLRTASVEELQSFFRESGRIDFEPSAGDFSGKGFRLMGGSISDIGNLASTLVVYDSAHGKVVCRRFREGTIDVPKSGEQIGNRRIFTVDGITFGVTRLQGGVICILATKMPRDTFIEHLEQASA